MNDFNEKLTGLTNSVKSGTESNLGFGEIVFPLVKSVFSTTLAGNTPEQMERIENDIRQENRNSKLENLFDGTEYVEKKITDHKDYNEGLIPVTPLNPPSGQIYHVDYIYGTSK